MVKISGVSYTQAYPGICLGITSLCPGKYQGMPACSSCMPLEQSKFTVTVLLSSSVQSTQPIPTTDVYELLYKDSLLMIK